MFQTSLSCSRLLLGVPGGVVMEMLQCNRTLMAMATLVYAPVPIEEVSLSLPLTHTYTHTHFTYVTAQNFDKALNLQLQ